MATGNGYAILNFGTGSTTASVIVTGQTSITNDCAIGAFLMADSIGANNSAAHIAATMYFTPVAGNVVPGTGFTIYAQSSISLSGTYYVRWAWSDSVLLPQAAVIATTDLADTTVFTGSISTSGTLSTVDQPDTTIISGNVSGGMVTFSNINTLGLPRSGFVVMNHYGTASSDNTRRWTNYINYVTGPQAVSRQVTVTTTTSGTYTTLSVYNAGTAWPNAYVDGLTMTKVSGTGPASIVITSGQILGNGSSSTLTIPSQTTTSTVGDVYTIAANKYHSPGQPYVDEGSSYSFLPSVITNNGWPTETFTMVFGAMIDAYTSRVYSCGFLGSVASVSLSTGIGSTIDGATTFSGTATIAAPVNGVSTLTLSTAPTGTLRVGHAINTASGYIGHVLSGSGLSWTVKNAGGYTGSATGSTGQLTHITYQGSLSSAQDYSTFVYLCGSSSAQNLDTLQFNTPSGTFANLQLVAPDDGLPYGTTSIYTNAYTTQTLKWGGIFRTMQWQQVWNLNGPMPLQTSWNTRPWHNVKISNSALNAWQYSSTPGLAFSNGNTSDFHMIDPYSSENYRFSYESIIEHAINFNMIPWICVPGLADDTYRAGLAALFAANMGTLPVMIEHGNENWNNSGNTYQQVYADMRSLVNSRGDTTYATDFQTTAAFVSNSTNGVIGTAGTTLTFNLTATVTPALTVGVSQISWTGFTTLPTAYQQGTATVTAVGTTGTNQYYVCVTPTGAASTGPTSVTPAATLYVYLSPFYNGVNVTLLGSYYGQSISYGPTQSNKVGSNATFAAFRLRMAFDAFAYAYAKQNPAATFSGYITGTGTSAQLTVTSGTVPTAGTYITGPMAYTNGVWTAYITSVAGSVCNLSNGVAAGSSGSPIAMYSITAANLALIRPVYAWQIDISSGDPALTLASFFMDENKVSWGSVNSWLYGFAVAPYVATESGMSTANPTAAMNNMFNDGALTNDNVPTTTAAVCTDVVNNARYFGVPAALTYEGGPAVRYMYDRYSGTYSAAFCQSCYTYSAQTTSITSGTSYAIANLGASTTWSTYGGPASGAKVGTTFTASSTTTITGGGAVSTLQSNGLPNWDLASGAQYQWNSLRAAGLDVHCHFWFEWMPYNTGSNGQTNFNAGNDVYAATTDIANNLQYQGYLAGTIAPDVGIAPGRFNGVIAALINSNIVQYNGGILDCGLNLQILYYLNGGYQKVHVNGSNSVLYFQQTGAGGTVMTVPFSAYLPAGTSHVRYAINYGGSGSTYTFNVKLRAAAPGGTDVTAGTTTVPTGGQGAGPLGKYISSKFMGYINASGQFVVTTAASLAPSTGDIMSYGGPQPSTTPTTLGSYVSGGTGANTVGAIYSLGGFTPTAAVASSAVPIPIQFTNPANFTAAVALTIPTTGWYVITVQNANASDTANVGLDAIYIY